MTPYAVKVLEEGDLINSQGVFSAITPEIKTNFEYAPKAGDLFTDVSYNSSSNSITFNKRPERILSVNNNTKFDTLFGTSEILIAFKFKPNPNSPLTLNADDYLEVKNEDGSSSLYVYKNNDLFIKLNDNSQPLQGTRVEYLNQGEAIKISNNSNITYFDYNDGEWKEAKKESIIESGAHFIYKNPETQETELYKFHQKTGLQNLGNIDLKIKDLMPSGIDQIKFSQGRMGNCSTLSMLHNILIREDSINRILNQIKVSPDDSISFKLDHPLKVKSLKPGEDEVEISEISFSQAELNEMKQHFCSYGESEIDRSSRKVQGQLSGDLAFHIIEESYKKLVLNFSHNFSLSQHKDRLNELGVESYQDLVDINQRMIDDINFRGSMDFNDSSFLSRELAYANDLYKEIAHISTDDKKERKERIVSYLSQENENIDEEVVDKRIKQFFSETLRNIKKSMFGGEISFLEGTSIIPKTSTSYKKNEEDVFSTRNKPRSLVKRNLEFFFTNQAKNYQGVKIISNRNAPNDEAIIGNSDNGKPIYSLHGWSYNSYDPNTKEITLTNPHDTAVEESVKINLDRFMDLFADIELYTYP